ncbi:glycosylinositol phosphorylceramide mannosyl transferase 1 [Malania oleifera]|uniref:glycosylinositol phosphorylceramide mannosyl transferase 1 n=1 Tax=Malania oleifera TaxID=397392 RepID=UPI0025AE15F6|nr:glycosylinositol phosphorylceramide mannosyl transferase 1 [Malania oleifera]
MTLCDSDRRVGPRVEATAVMRGTSCNRRAIQIQRLPQAAISAVGSIKIKLLLLCCIIFTLILLASRGASFMGWTHHAAASDRFSAMRNGYAILINTWKRNDLLKQSISHYASCAGLDSIHIVWSEPDPPSDSLTKFLHHVIQSNARDGRQVVLKFDFSKEDSLNNRFKEIKDLKTDAVFSVDDDVIFPCSTVEFAFSVWESAPDTMVGFVPRAHWVDQSKGHKHYYIYGGWWSVWWTGTYSMVLSKAAFFHKNYLRLYTNEMPASIREYVTKNRNCEDIAMSFLVANATGAPPIWVKGKIFEIGSTGISSLGGHSERRSQCVNKFVAVYGRMPLVSTSVKAVDSRSTWLW